MKNLLLLLFSLFVALAGAEIYLRINPPVSVYIATRNIVQQTHSQASPDSLLVYVPRAGLEKAFRNREFNTQIKINSQTLRDREYPLQKSAGIKRIAAVGDSFVFGWGVENNEVFTEILETEQLKNTEVLNLGVSGYLAYQELERLKVDGLKFQPDIVLFFLYGWPDPRPQTPDRFEVREGILQSKDFPALPLKAKIAFSLERHFYLFALYQEFRGSLRISKETTPPDPELFPSPDSGLGILKEFKDLAAQQSFVPIVIYIPVKEAAKRGEEPEAAVLSNFCGKHGLSFLDLTPALHEFWVKGKKSPYFRLDDHWNPEGHRAVAGILAEYLKKEKLV